MKQAINLPWNGLWKAHPERQELMVQRELRKRVIWLRQKESLAKHIHRGRLKTCFGEDWCGVRGALGKRAGGIGGALGKDR